jgi:hypothetical protein
MFLNIKTLFVVFLLGSLNFCLNVKLYIIMGYKNLSFDHILSNKVVDHILRYNTNIIFIALGIVFLIELNSIFKSGIALNLLESKYYKSFTLRIFNIIMMLSILIVFSFITCSIIVPINISYFIDVFNILGINCELLHVFFNSIDLLFIDI